MRPVPYFLGNLFTHSRLIYNEAGDKKEVVPWQS